MEYYVLITDKSDASHIYIADHEDDDSAVYMWSEGNFECDCNRGLFYDGGEYECNTDDRRFNVSVFNKDNELIYSDKED